MEGAAEKGGPERTWNPEREVGSRDVSQRQEKEAALMGKHNGR